MPSLILRLEPLDDVADAASVTSLDAAVHAVRDLADTPDPASPTGPDVSRDADDADDADESVGWPAPTVIDVASHERRAAAALSRWSDAVDGSPDGCLVLDPQGCIVSVSDSGADLLGCSDGCVGRPLLEVVEVVDLETGARDPDYATRITPLAAARGNGLMRSFMRVRRSSGELLSLDTASAPVHDVDGNVVGSVSFLSAIDGG